MRWWPPNDPEHSLRMVAQLYQLSTSIILRGNTTSKTRDGLAARSNGLSGYFHLCDPAGHHGPVESRQKLPCFFFLHPLILSGYGGWEDPTSEKKILSLLAARKKSSMLLVAPALYAAPTLWIFSELRKPWDLDFLGLLSSALQGSCQDILCH